MKTKEAKPQVTVDAMNKRGQAAMEFLMTYGWAILAAIIVVGVLWYLIGNPSDLAGDRFQIASPFVNIAHSLTAGTPGTVKLEIRNGYTDSVNITSVSFPDEGCIGTPNLAIAAGNVSVVTVNCNLVSGDRFNSEIVLQFKKAGSTLTEQRGGTISATVP